MLHLPESSTWQIYDSSKLSDYQRCARLAFFKHILGWKTDAESKDLVHGKAWHRSMRHLAHHYPYTDTKTLLAAYNEYLPEYLKGFPDPTTHAANHPKVPGMVGPALAGYALEFNDQDAKCETLYTEIGGSTMISKEHKIHFKLDTILHDARGYFSREHKTSVRQSDQWRNKWRMATQVGTYHHVLCCLYPPEDVWGVEINGSFWHKNETVFERLPVRRKVEMLEAWRVNTSYWISLFKQDTEKIASGFNPDDDTMNCFAQNPEACADYYGCPYINFCMAWPNPLAHFDEIPLGFKREYWDPTIMELDKEVTL